MKVKTVVAEAIIAIRVIFALLIYLFRFRFKVRSLMRWRWEIGVLEKGKYPSLKEVYQFGKWLANIY